MSMRLVRRVRALRTLPVIPVKTGIHVSESVGAAHPTLDGDDEGNITLLGGVFKSLADLLNSDNALAGSLCGRC